MERELWFGLMAQSMKGSGSTIWQMEKGGSSMLMGVFMKDNGKMIKLMVKEYILIQMVQYMKETL